MRKSYMFLSRVVMVVVLSCLGVSPVAADDEGCYCSGMTGNVNCDYQSRVTIGDIGILIDHLFISHARLPNRQEADVNCNGKINVGDVAALADHLFISHTDLCDCPKAPNAPPETQIVGHYPGVPFINWSEPGGITTGVHMQWEGRDLVDHPYYPPDFEFEWQLLGPYTDDDLLTIKDRFIERVFRTYDHQILPTGEPLDTLYCDTFWTQPDIDSIVCKVTGTHFEICDTSYELGEMQISCDSILVDTIQYLNPYGTYDTLFRVDDFDFWSSMYNRVVALSTDDGGLTPWTHDNIDSLYDVYWKYPADTTRTMNFIFWVRARDPVDSELLDPTPAHVFMSVIDPKFERDVLVVSFNNSADEQRADFGATSDYWDRAIHDWVVRTGQWSVDYEPDFDFRRHSSYGYTQGYHLIEDALKYKTVIITQDAAVSGSWSGGGLPLVNLQIAMLTGVNSWTAARVPIGNHPFLSQRDVEHADAAYQYFWGVDSVEYTGWSYPLLFVDPNYRLEDFVGAFSQNPAGWPDLEVDTAALHWRYRWSAGDGYGWASPNGSILGALPEVNWAEPVAGDPAIEVLYTYQSLYGDVHALDSTLSFEGRPVMQRLDRGYFRSVHSMFTPVALDESSAQVMIDSVMEYLYDPNLSQPVSGARDRRISGSMSAKQGRELYLQLRRQFGELYETASKEPIAIDRMRREN